jgi:hypothetical protein
MAPDIAEVTNLLLEEKIWGAVQHHIAYYHAPEVNVSLSDFQGQAQVMTLWYNYAAHTVSVQKVTSDFD